MRVPNRRFVETSEPRTPHSIWQKTLPYKTPKSIPIGAYKIEAPKVTKENLLRLRSDVPPMREAAQMYKVVDTNPCTHTVEGKEYPAYECITKDQGTWIIIFPDYEYQLDLQKNPLPLNGAKEALRRRQERFRPPLTEAAINKNVQGEVEHEEVILLMMANWGKWAGRFYKDNVITGRHLERWHEVDVSHYGVIYQNKHGKIIESSKTCGKPDFVGEGPDWQPIIIEAGAIIPRKIKQLDRGIIGIQAVIEEANHGNEVASPHGFIATFWKEDDKKIVHFRSPQELKKVVAE